MKKFISVALAFLMIAAMLVVTVSAKDPYGTVVEVPYSDKAPSMDDALPDASWVKSSSTLTRTPRTQASHSTRT